MDEKKSLEEYLTFPMNILIFLLIKPRKSKSDEHQRIYTPPVSTKLISRSFSFLSFREN